MKRLMLLNLLMLLFAGAGFVEAQELRKFSMQCHQDPLDLTAQKEHKDDGDGYDYAVVKVTSDDDDVNLNDLTFRFGQMKSSKEMRDGELWYFVQRNAKNVRITGKGFKPVDQPLGLTIEAGKTYRMTLNFQKQKMVKRILQFKVSPANEGAIVKVKAEGAADDYQLWGTVDAQGCIDRLLPTGTYLYEVSAASYATAQGRVTLVKGEGNSVETVTLRPNFGYLEITDANGIAGAEVYVNNQKVGTVPYKSDRMECGSNYQLMISKGELYKTFSSTFEIRSGETTKLSPHLLSNFAETTIKVDNNAEIFVNGESKGKGSWTGPLSAGDYDIECRLPYHTPSTKQIEVKPDVSEIFIIDTPKPIEGILYVTSKPSGAKIQLDGKDLGKTPWNGAVLIGKHQVAVMMDNYKTEIRDVDIRMNEESTVDVKLSDMARMTLKSNPSGAKLYINGDYKGTTPFTAEMTSGDYDVRLEKEQCRTLFRRVHLDSANPEKTFSLSRQYQQPSQFYLQPTLQVGGNTAAGIAIGCYLSNLNVEVDALYGMASETIYWNDANGNLAPAEDKLTPLNLAARLGWGFILDTRLRLTPQLGAGLVSVSGTESNCHAIKASFGVRADYVLTNHIGLVVAPEYGVALSKSNVFEMISANSSKVKGWGSGFNCRVGLNIYF